MIEVQVDGKRPNARNTQMPAAISSEPTESARSGSFPKRDFILLPLIGLLTVVGLIGISESVARLVWPEQARDTCEYFSALGYRHKPFCSSMLKNVEGPWVRYRYNACGYRGTASCGPKSPSTVRFVIMGTSIAFGLYVPDDQLFSVRSLPGLRKIFGRPVEFENLGMIGPAFPLQYQLAGEIQQLQPDGVFFVLVPYDLKRLDDTPLWAQKETPKERHFVDFSKLAYLGRSSRTFFMAQHFLLSDEDFAVRAFLMKGDADDVAQVPDTALAEQRWRRFSLLVRRLSEELRNRRIPLYLIALPSRLQAALIGRNISQPGLDPLAFPHRVAAIAQAAGARSIDLLPELQRTPHPERLFYPVDGHLNAAGNQLIAAALVDYFKRRESASR